MKLFNIIISLLALLLSTSAGPIACRAVAPTCVVPAGGSPSIDDAPAILAAFKKCGQGGTISFSNTTYHVNTVMNTTGLKDCVVDLRGTLLWSTNIAYWLAHSLPVGYQNQSSAWFFGGENVTFQGHGYGTLDGNGQTWYTYIHGKSNYPGRPHAITISKTKNSVFTGIRFVQSQMWTMAIIHGSNILLEDIYISNTSNDGSSTSNTDGADTIYSDNITFNRWTVTNGDDAISFKANSTNILVTNSVFHKGLGLAFGSIGQYKGAFETIQNVTARNITLYNSLHAAYIKTWTGQQVGYPPNGGGGGFGFIKNVNLNGFHLNSVKSPFTISQCTTFSGSAGDCNSSLFKIQDVTFENAAGTVTNDPIASLQCSAAAPCSRIAIEGMSLKLTNGTAAKGYNCNAVVDQIGFNCTGVTCGKPSAAGTC